MTTVTIEEAQAKLPELLSGLSQGEELAIIQGDQVVARIVGERAEPGNRPRPGFAKGMLTVIVEDNEHREDFAEVGPDRASIGPDGGGPAGPTSPGELQPRRAGSAKDKILWISPDFDAPLEEFRGYME